MSDYFLGPCKIEFKGSDLGLTEGGITLSANMNSVVLHADQYGETPLDEYQTGLVVQVKGKLAGITLANLAALFHTTVQISATKQKVVVAPGVGTSLPDQGGLMVIKPYISGIVTTDKNKWITMYKAGMKAVLSMQFDSKTQQVLDFEATGYADSSGNVVIFGDTTF